MVVYYNKGFTLIELIVVITIIGLALSIVSLRMNLAKPSDETLLRMFVLESIKISKRENREIILTASKDGIVSSDGRYAEIEAEGSCVVKPSGRITLCKFKMRNKEIWITDVDY